MKFLIVPIGDNPPRNENRANMDFIVFVNSLRQDGYDVPLDIAWHYWCVIRDRWNWTEKNAEEAMFSVMNFCTSWDW